MTIEVTIKVNINPPGTCVQVNVFEVHPAGYRQSQLAQLGAGETWTGTVQSNQQLRLTPLNIIDPYQARAFP